MESFADDFGESNRRVKRSFPACPCQNTLSSGAIGAWSDMFLYTNGRCYAQFVDGPYTYASAQSLCQIVMPALEMSEEQRLSILEQTT